MKRSILFTKLQRPPVAPDIVPRDRLLDRLNAGLQRPLTLISAPAGYGKSTLASRWAAGCDYPNAWVSLEESDSDLQMFLSYVLAAIQMLFPRTKFRTEAILETSQMPPAADLARHLLNDLNQISEPFKLVLDDYHRIQRGSPVNDLLDEFLAYPPRGMHLVLLTRHDPSLPIATMRGRREMAILRSVGARPMHVLSLIVGEAGLVTLMGIATGIVLLYGLLVLGQPLLASRFGLLIGISGLTTHEMLLMGIVCVAGVLIGVIPGIRIYRHSLADGLTVRV